MAVGDGDGFRKTGFLEIAPEAKQLYEYQHPTLQVSEMETFSGDVGDDGAGGCW